MSVSSLGTFRSNILRDQAQGQKMFLRMFLGRASDGLHGQGSTGNADVMIDFLQFGLRLDVVGIVKHDAALLERAEMVLVGMLVEGQEHVAVVARAEHFAGADADLENGGPPDIVEGMVMNVMTSCSLLPAKRARNPPRA